MSENTASSENRSAVAGKRRGRINDCRTVQSVVDHKVCCGCGACTALCPVNCIEFVYGKRYNYPRIDTERCTECGRCLKVCPSEFLLRGTDPGFQDRPREAALSCHLVHASDDQIRYEGASGGGITGLLCHLMGNGDIDGAIVARTDPERPLVSQTLIARDKDSLLSAQGSRYAPVSNCTALREVAEVPGRYAIVGTPCMLQATTRAQELLASLRERIVLKIGFVCSGMASRASTKAYLLRYGIDPEIVREIRYRGEGWPGCFRAHGNHQLVLKRPYFGDELEYLVASDRYLRCWNCSDHWGRFADIVASDPWCEQMIEHEHEGRSAMMVRTEQGAATLESAIRSGSLVGESISADTMVGYNGHLLDDDKHSQHSWMASYQCVFCFRLKYAPRLVYSLVRRRPTGLVTTLKAKLAKQYYEWDWAA